MVDDKTPKQTNDTLSLLSAHKSTSAKERQPSSQPQEHGPKFHKIEADHYHLDHARVQSLLKLLKKTQRLELSLEEKRLATFLIAESDKRDVYGGVVLLKQRVRNRKKKSGSHYAFKGEKIWTCCSVLHLDKKDPIYMNGQQRAFFREFYGELYEMLSDFGHKMGTPFVWMTLAPEEGLCLEALGNFPFMVKIKPHDAVDGLFHGLLAIEEGFAKACVVPKDWAHPPLYKLVSPKKEKN